MRSKHIFLFIVLQCLIHTNIYAKDVMLPVDTVALDAGLAEMWDSSNADKADFSLYFMQNIGKKLSAKAIIIQCKKTIKNNIDCMNFIKTYNDYLNNANSCSTANNTEVVAGTSKNWRRFNFKECYNYVQGTSKTEYNYEVSEKCTFWVKEVEKCVVYMKNLYTQKNKANKYDCVLNNLNEGIFELPLTQESLERECDSDYRRIKAETDYEMLMSM